MACLDCGGTDESTEEVAKINGKTISLADADRTISILALLLALAAWARKS